MVRRKAVANIKTSCDDTSSVLSFSSTKPSFALHVREDASRHLLMRPQPQHIENPRIQTHMDSLNSHPEIARLLDLMWEKDPDTYHHGHRVADLAQAIGRELGLSAAERVDIYLSGLLHDIGKLFTPDRVLKKPGALNPEEFAVMRLHPEDSAKIVRTIADIGYLTEAIRGHHERIDGHGYPDQKAGDTIPLISRIVLVADTFDAMTNTRVYRKQIDLGRTYDEITRCSGTQFDRGVATAFVAMHQRFTNAMSQNPKKPDAA